jgi:hypothetical protein
MKDVPATEAMPPFRDRVTYRLRVDGSDSAEVRTERVGKADKACAIHVTAAGSLEEWPSFAKCGRALTRNELRRASRGPIPEAYRPRWLNQVYLPRVWPHRLPSAYYGVRTSVKPLILELLDTGWPWTPIGKLFIQRRGQNPKIGSGVLVGPNLLLTASHAMPWDTNDSSVRFVPAYRNGNNPAFGHAYVDDWRGIYHPEGTATGLDYVICKLNWRIGDRTGWLGSWYFYDQDSYDDQSYISVGYPKSFLDGQVPAVEFNATVEDIDNEGDDGLEIETDDFTDGGWSGGPLWGWVAGDARVIGICSGKDDDFLDPERSVFAGGKHLVDLVRYGWANWT